MTPRFRAVYHLGTTQNGEDRSQPGITGQDRSSEVRDLPRNRERVTGVEPATLCLASTRSSQLSYTRKSEEVLVLPRLCGVKLERQVVSSTPCVNAASTRLTGAGLDHPIRRHKGSPLGSTACGATGRRVAHRPRLLR